MFAKSTQIGLVSLFVVLATALGGCAESIGSEPANAPIMTRPIVALSRYAPPVASEPPQVVKVETVASRTELKHQTRTADAR
jgi:hypothetical protein